MGQGWDGASGLESICSHQGLQKVSKVTKPDLDVTA